VVALIQYQALDNRGEELLDELERRSSKTSRRMPTGAREFHLLEGDVLDPVLDEIEPDWGSHVGRLTE